MTYSFYSNRKYLLLVLGMMLCTLCSCKQSKPQTQEKGVTKEELAAMLDSVKAAAKEEAKAEMQAETPSESSAQSSSEDYALSSSTSSSSDDNQKQVPQETAYKKGYDYGVESSHIYGGLKYFLEDDARQLKQYYMNIVATDQINGIGEQYKTNREMFDEFKRGFIKGHEDGNAL